MGLKIRTLFFLLFLCLHCFLHCGDAEYSITPYTVGPQGKARFQTIQSALRAAHGDGGGIVVLQPGVYKENLVLYDKTQVVGAIGLGDFGDFVIDGTHVPPNEGAFSFRNVFLKGKNSIFSDDRSGLASLMLIDVAIGVYDGYTFDLPNWKGLLAGFDIGIIDAKNDGWVNNSAGCTVFFTNVTIGSGSKNTMKISGNTFFFGAAVKCPAILFKNSNGKIAGGTICENTISFYDDASFDIYNSTFLTMENPAVKYYSRKPTNFSSVNIISSHQPQFIGNGSGLITFNSVSFLYENSLDESLNKAGGNFITGSLTLNTKGKGISIAEGKDSKIGVSKLINGKVYVDNSTVTESSRIFITTQSDSPNTGYLRVSRIDNRRGFEIKSSNPKDDSTAAWLIIEGT